MIISVEQHEYAYRANLLNQIFNTRKKVFVDEMGWDIPVTNGQEIDQYDNLGATYLILTDPDQRIAFASCRIMSTTGPTLLHDVFHSTMPDAGLLVSPTIWECTRFCVDAEADAKRTQYRDVHAASLLLLGGCEFGLAKGIESYVANFDPLMTRIYRRAGCEVDVLGHSMAFGNRPVACGVLEVSERIEAKMRTKLGVQHSLYEPSASPWMLERAVG